MSSNIPHAPAESLAISADVPGRPLARSPAPPPPPASRHASARRPTVASGVTSDTVKYNRVRNSQTSAKDLGFSALCLITLDWLTVRITDSLPAVDEECAEQLPGRVILHRERGRTRNHDARGYLFLEEHERPVARVVWSEISGVTSIGAQLTLENWTLYALNPRELLRRLTFALTSDVIGITRLDVAADGAQLRTLVEQDQFNLGTVARLSRTKLRAQWRKECHGFDQFESVTRADSPQVTFKYYDKTREIEEHSKKAYITEWHRENGLTEQVDRFEFRLSSAYFYRSRLDVGSLDALPLDPAQLVALFQNCERRFFAWRLCDARNTSRCTRLTPFTFKSTPALLATVPEREVSGERTAKLLIKRTLADQSDGAGIDASAIDHAATYVQLYSLADWLRDRAPIWQKALRAEALTGARTFSPADFDEFTRRVLRRRHLVSDRRRARRRLTIADGLVVPPAPSYPMHHYLNA